MPVPVAAASPEHMTFKPEVDPVSREIASRMFSADGKKRWEQLYEMEKKKREKLTEKNAMQNEEREMRDKEECTFSPELKAKAPNMGTISGDIFKRT